MIVAGAETICLGPTMETAPLPWADTTPLRSVGFAKRRCQFEPTIRRRPSRRMAGAPSRRSAAVDGTIQIGTICRVAAD